MNYFLEKLSAGELLTAEEAELLMEKMADAKTNQFQIAAILGILNTRSISIEEIKGFRTAIMNAAKTLQLDTENTIDVCGTGGDGKNTFNISTTSAFVLAGAGIKVTKHGNHGVSSTSGSSTVLEQVGLKFTSTEDQLKKQLDKAGICFLHAPLFHPALKNVGSIRKNLGIKTIFNLLGPLTNPSSPKFQVVGVYKLELARLYSSFLENENKNYAVVHGIDGYDEVSLTGAAKLFTSNGELIINAIDFNISKLNPSDLNGGSTPEKSASIFINILKNESNQQQREVVCANAAIGIQCIYPEINLFDAFQIANESISSGRAYRCFKKLIELS